MHAALSSSVPAFLAKLWSMVHEESTDSVIGWTEDNKSFYIRNQSVFSMELLPVYYKHNNMASFVRQLNMYGFRKVLSPMAGSLRNDSDEMIFAHSDFVKDAPWGLDNIKRKIPHHKDLGGNSSELMARLYGEVKTMKGKQDSLDSHLTKMKRENESLWREVLVLRQKHSKQQQIVNKLIQFLVSFVQPNRGAASSMGLKRKQLPMLEDGGGSQRGAPSAKAPRLARTFSMDENVAAAIETRPMTSSVNSPDGPVIHDVTDQVVSPSGSIVVGSTASSQLPINFMASPDRHGSSTVDWTPLVETLASSAAATLPAQEPEEKEPDKEELQAVQNTTVALAAGDATNEPTPVLCDSLLESIQADLDGLRGLIGSPNWRVDTSSMQNILLDPEQAVPAAGGGAESDQQLISYNPSLLDLFSSESDELFPDLRGLDEDEEELMDVPGTTSAGAAGAATPPPALTAAPASSAAASTTSGRTSGLNTPTIEMRGPAFPVPPPAVSKKQAAPATSGRSSGLKTPTIEIPKTPFPAPPPPASKRGAKRRK